MPTIHSQNIGFSKVFVWKLHRGHTIILMFNLQRLFLIYQSLLLLLLLLFSPCLFLLFLSPPTPPLLPGVLHTVQESQPLGFSWFSYLSILTSNCFCFPSFLSYYFCSAEDRTQDLVHARQALYTWATCPTLKFSETRSCCGGSVWLWTVDPSPSVSSALGFQGCTISTRITGVHHRAWSSSSHFLLE